MQEEINRAIAEWRKRHPEATLSEIEDEVDKGIAEIRTQMVEDPSAGSGQALAQQGRMADLTQLAEGERPHCPQCGGVVVANGKQKRWLVTRHGHQIKLQRSKAYCRHCQVSFFPSG